MTAPLSPSQSKVLSLATIDWREIPRKIDAVALSSLKAAGRVQTRFNNTDRNHLAVAEWRKTPEQQ